MLRPIAITTVRVQWVYRFLALIALFAAVFPAYAQYANTPHGLNEAAFWLDAQAQELIRQSQRPCPTAPRDSSLPRAALSLFLDSRLRLHVGRVARRRSRIPSLKTAVTPWSTPYAATVMRSSASTPAAARSITALGTIAASNFSGVNPTADNSQFTTDIAWRTYKSPMTRRFSPRPAAATAKRSSTIS